ncbi:hypothetical protein RvY_16014-3 [Ramazzottius varieornatus]|uniref:Uncharacterized protein n=1 Tax=Ramazzottius varieornatus TaxID=947166 RepID=A0A1D1W1H8_RAMVA|nr:hypothetical protein RvY_16014-3 [Ramazzottius varieornatus]
MTPFSNTLHKLSFIGGRKKKDLCATGKSDICGDSDICGARSCSPPIDNHPLFEEPPLLYEPPAANEPATTGGCPLEPSAGGCPLELPSASNAKPAQKFEAFCGPCATSGRVEPPPCPEECDQHSINTFLRPDNLLMGDANIRMDQTKPYLVGNKLMREIPLRDTTKILNDKELRGLHWVIGESVERHGILVRQLLNHIFRNCCSRN